MVGEAGWSPPWTDTHLPTTVSKDDPEVAKRSCRGRSPMILNIGGCAQRKLGFALSSSAIPSRKGRCWRSRINMSRSHNAQRSEWEKRRNGRLLHRFSTTILSVKNDGFECGGNRRCGFIPSNPGRNPWFHSNSLPTRLLRLRQTFPANPMQGPLRVSRSGIRMVHYSQQGPCCLHFLPHPS
jgi:hypothetical protein